MGNDLLKDELKDLQSEYKKILERASKDIFKNNSTAVVDEINVFWYRNRKIVQCVLRNLCSPYHAYVFTGATILDMADYEHYPFVTLGKCHFFDDPISKYATIVEKTKKTVFTKQLQEQTLATINDNLVILEQAEDIIYILPIRLLSEFDNQFAHKAAMQAFLSLFKEKFVFEDYRKRFKTIEDIIGGLSPHMGSGIIFSKEDDTTLDLKTRFNNYKNTNSLPLPVNASDAEIFWFCLYAFFSQAFDIIFMCAEYQLIPYVRFDVTFKYILSLSANFEDSQEIKDMIFKCAIAHILYRTFDKEKFASFNFREYYHSVQLCDFESNLFYDLRRENITFPNPSLAKIAGIIEKNFDRLFSELKK